MRNFINLFHMRQFCHSIQLLFISVILLSVLNVFFVIKTRKKKTVDGQAWINTQPRRNQNTVVISSNNCNNHENSRNNCNISKLNYNNNIILRHGI